MNDKTETYVKCIIPISPRAEEIIKRYKGKTKNNSIMPFLCEQHYNRRLKELAKEAGLKRKVIKFDTKTKEEKTIQIWQIISSHAARKYFINLLMSKGVHPLIISSMTGHSPRSKAFSRYFSDPAEHKANVMKKFFA